MFWIPHVCVILVLVLLPYKKPASRQSRSNVQESVATIRQNIADITPTESPNSADIPTERTNNANNSSPSEEEAFEEQLSENLHEISEIVDDIDKGMGRDVFERSQSQVEDEGVAKLVLPLHERANEIVDDALETAILRVRSAVDGTEVAKEKAEVATGGTGDVAQAEGDDKKKTE